MAILKVARLGHPVLRQPCRDLTPEEIRSDRIQTLVEDMRVTMAEYGGWDSRRRRSTSRSVWR